MTVSPSMIKILLWAIAWAAWIIVGIPAWTRKSAEEYLPVRLLLSTMASILLSLCSFVYRFDSVIAQVFCSPSLVDRLSVIILSSNPDWVNRSVRSRMPGDVVGRETPLVNRLGPSFAGTSRPPQPRHQRVDRWRCGPVSGELLRGHRPQRGMQTISSPASRCVAH
jgi:hypothetical protein